MTPKASGRIRRDERDPPALPRARGDGPTLLLTHGLSANAHSLDVLAAHLAPALRVVVLDLRGRGESDRPETYAMADHAADVLGVMDAFGLERAPLGGHSFGVC